MSFYETLKDLLLTADLWPPISIYFGASLKDLGEKWFAFSKMDIGVDEMLRKLDGMR
jgi:hypothetical protein